MPRGRTSGSASGRSTGRSSSRSGSKARSRGFAAPGASTGGRGFARTDRVNESLREVIAEELEEIDDERLEMVTVTGIDVEADFHQAVVYYSALTASLRSESAEAEVAEALDEHRIRLQAAIGRQVRLKRTPLLTFRPDPAISEGAKIDHIIRSLPRPAAPIEQAVATNPENDLAENDDDE
jgi:ribosome-binding factor A